MKDWKKWAKCAGIRAVKTVVSASVLAGILSLLTSVATGLPECSEGE